MTENVLLESISRKLDIVIGLLLRMQPKSLAEKDQILALKNTGMTVDEIARILGKSSNSIYIKLSRSKKR